jgi:hypothetical protein
VGKTLSFAEWNTDADYLEYLPVPIKQFLLYDAITSFNVRQIYDILHDDPDYYGDWQAVLRDLRRFNREQHERDLREALDCGILGG